MSEGSAERRIGRDLFDLTGRVALVTGAGSGLGEAIAIGLAAFGADLALLDVEAAALERVGGAIRDAGRRAIGIVCDVSRIESVQAAVDRTVVELGRLDVVVNNAGISRRAPADAMTEEQWDQVLDIDLKGPFLVAQAAGRVMIERGGGRIINMASVAGQVAVRTGNANYSAAKGGVIALTRALAIEWAKHNVLVNAIAPTHFRTPLIARLMENPDTHAVFLRNIPLGRVGEPWEIVGPVIFLASDASTMVTGTVLNVDGGHVAQ